MSIEAGDGPMARENMATADQLAEVAKRSGVTIATAESLTAGNVATALGAAPDAAVWYRGGVVAYAADVKRCVLGVPDVPVVSETAARAMAEGVRSLMDADIAVATTGVGGPDPQDGEAAGSVWFCVVSRSDARVSHRQYDGDPAEVVDRSVKYAIELLLSMAKVVHS
ncbi:CinA family protein [Nocardia salmonicida]|uniref:CinA family protein n=1 Tax=Nocardia salmonicida TaxID=53431 RepID=UPI00364AC90C